MIVYGLRFTVVETGDYLTEEVFDDFNHIYLTHNLAHFEIDKRLSHGSTQKIEIVPIEIKEA